MRIPCVKKRGLKIFAPTADQRHALGDDIFLRTHYPISYRRFRGSELIENWHEDDILKFFNEETTDKSNRVFILFGAAGSGKSESIRWIEHHVNFWGNDKKIFRISRTELDPVHILNRLIELAGESMNKSILMRWESLKKKPVSLANTLVWDALNYMLERDEDIIPLSYKIRPLVESSLRRSFHGKDKNLKPADKVELLTLEEWESVKQNSAVDFDLEYEHFRKCLIDRFEKEVLGGYDFVAALAEVGNKLFNKTGQRPLLLIDDLVQSMSIYSSDLLDYFITLEEGSWDIVIGLTPASFETSKRGKELLDRINYLDTFDDRIYKLWLTDEFGEESYTLDSNTVKDYLSNYMAEYKRMNKYECGTSCSYYDKCIKLHWNEDDVALTPLNGPLVQRMFDNIFKGKGFSRHIIVTVSEFLSSVINGTEVEFLTDRIKREKNTDIDDLEAKILVESYIPLDAEGVFKVPKDFYKTLGIRGKRNQTVKVSSLVQSNNNSINVSSDTKKIEFSPELAAIRDWLEGKGANKELLRKLRLSCYSFIREFLPKSSIVRSNTSRPQGSIKYEKYIEGCRLPLSFEGVDSYKGIVVRRSIGMDAYEFLNLKELDQSSQMAVINKLISKQEVSKLLGEVTIMSNEWVEKIENAINMKCYELAFLLFVFVFHVCSFERYPHLLKKNYHHSALKELPSSWQYKKVELSEKTIRFIDDFFKDWFLLRENLYDAYLLSKLIDRYASIETVLEAILQVQLQRVTPEYKVGTEPLYEVLLEVTNSVKSLNDILRSDKFNEECEMIFLEMVDFNQLGENELENIIIRLEVIEQKCSKIGKAYSFLKPPSSKVDIVLPTNINKMEIVSLIATQTNNPIYTWATSLKRQLVNICADYEALLNSYHKMKGIINHKPLGNLYFKEKLDLISLLSLTEQCIDNSESIIIELNQHKQLSEYFKASKVDLVKDTLIFIDYFQEFLNNSRQDVLGVKHMSKLGEEYLNIIGRKNKIGEVNKHSEVIIEAYNLFNQSKVSKMKEYVCSEIKKKLFLSFHLLNGEYELKEKYNALTDMLNKISVGESHGYKDIYELLKEWQVYTDELYNDMNNKFSISAKKLLSLLLKGERVFISANDYSFIKEIEDKLPSLENKVVLEILIKHS